jgi:O-methyltransferase
MNARLKVIAQRAASSLDTLQASYDLARLAIQNDVPGDFVECGVFAGAQCAAMALAIMDEWPGEVPECDCNACKAVRRGRYARRVHLFDGFAGVPAAGEHDKQWAEAGHPVGQSAASLEDVKSNMAEWGIDPALLVYHPGYFSETVAYINPRNRVMAASMDRIAILRIDGDLYESTKVCLEHLYPLVSPGGWIIADDFGLDGARKAIIDYMGGGARFGPVTWIKE